MRGVFAIVVNSYPHCDRPACKRNMGDALLWIGVIVLVSLLAFSSGLWWDREVGSRIMFAFMTTALYFFYCGRAWCRSWILFSDSLPRANVLPTLPLCIYTSHPVIYLAWVPGREHYEPQLPLAPCSPTCGCSGYILAAECAFAADLVPYAIINV